MKILYVSESEVPSNRANSVHVMKMCSALTENGNEVTLLAHRGNPSPAVHSERLASWYGIRESFRLLRLPLGASRVGRYFLGLLVVPIIARRYHLVISRNVPGACLSALMRVPTILEMHHDIPSRQIVKLKLLKLALAQYSLLNLIVISDSLAAHYRENFKNAEKKLRVLRDGADLSMPGSAGQANLLKGTGRGLQVAYIGSLSEGKGFELLVELAKRRPRMSFHLIGGDGKALAALVETTKDIQNLFVYGHLPHAEISNYLRHIDVGLLPNSSKVLIGDGRTDIGKWTSPLKMFEYMSAGVAIAASRLPVLEEVLTDEVTALFCEPNLADSWLNALDRFEADATFRKRLGLEGKRLLQDCFTWNRRAERMVEGLLPGAERR